MVERSLSMREVPGSIPGSSRLFSAAFFTQSCSCQISFSLLNSVVYFSDCLINFPLSFVYQMKFLCPFCFIISLIPRIISLISLGMPLSQALEILQLHSGVVQTALLTYSEQRPFEQDLSVDLNQDGIRLYFDPKSQRLKVVTYMFKELSQYI